MVTKKTENTSASSSRTKTTKKKPSPKTTAEKTIEAAEKKVDAAVSAATKKATAKVSPAVRAKAKKIVADAEMVATKIESVGQELDQVTDSILPEGTGSASSFHAEREPTVSRLFIFRFLRLILQGPIMCIWSLRYAIISLVHYVHMFLFGERSKYLREKQTRYRRHVITWKAYMNALTDKRPDLIVS